MDSIHTVWTENVFRHFRGIFDEPTPRRVVTVWERMKLQEQMAEQAQDMQRIVSDIVSSPPPVQVHLPWGGQSSGRTVDRNRQQLFQNWAFPWEPATEVDLTEEWMDRVLTPLVTFFWALDLIGDRDIPGIGDTTLNLFSFASLVHVHDMGEGEVTVESQQQSFLAGMRNLPIPWEQLGHRGIPPLFFLAFCVGRCMGNALDEITLDIELDGSKVRFLQASWFLVLGALMRPGGVGPKRYRVVLRFSHKGNRSFVPTRCEEFFLFLHIMLLPMLEPPAESNFFYRNCIGLRDFLQEQYHFDGSPNPACELVVDWQGNRTLSTLLMLQPLEDVIARISCRNWRCSETFMQYVLTDNRACLQSIFHQTRPLPLHLFALHALLTPDDMDPDVPSVIHKTFDLQQLRSLTFNHRPSTKGSAWLLRWLAQQCPSLTHLKVLRHAKDPLWMLSEEDMEQFPLASLRHVHISGRIPIHLLGTMTALHTVSHHIAEEDLLEIPEPPHVLPRHQIVHFHETALPLHDFLLGVSKIGRFASENRFHMPFVCDLEPTDSLLSADLGACHTVSMDMGEASEIVPAVKGLVTLSRMAQRVNLMVGLRVRTNAAHAIEQLRTICEWLKEFQLEYPSKDRHLFVRFIMPEERIRAPNHLLSLLTHLATERLDLEEPNMVHILNMVPFMQRYCQHQPSRFQMAQNAVEEIMDFLYNHFAYLMDHLEPPASKDDVFATCLYMISELFAPHIQEHVKY